ncbi:MAG: recombination associated protein [Smithella sp. PtaU1.Bin162]|nr:MAG: recombination associated protein [Smithella sp. PtaU1.Bin162]
MGLLKGNFSFARFHVTGPLPKAFLNFVESRIKANSFRETLKSAEEKRSGWVSVMDILDADFDKASYALGNYLIFSLRIDRKIIPPKLLKIKILEEERQFLAQTGKTRIHKQMADGIKDKVKLELLSRLDPVPSFYDVCWALGKNTVYFSSLSDKITDDFIDLFKKTFSLGLTRKLPQDHELVAKNVAAGSAKQAEEALVGREFMTWLWFKSEERNGRISLPRGNEVELNFARRIALAAGEGEYSQGVACHGIHSELTEGKEAIRQGKKVTEAGIRLIADQNEWEFTLKADNFHFQSLKLPPAEWQETSEDQSGKLLERIYLIENAAGIIDELYNEFLSIHYSPRWDENEMKLVTKWLHQ